MNRASSKYCLDSEIDDQSTTKVFLVVREVDSRRIKSQIKHLRVYCLKKVVLIGIVILESRVEIL